MEYDGLRFIKNGVYWRNKIVGQLHRYIWEKHNNCKIPKGYVIHHKDENVDNNDITNLILMSNPEHVRFHRKGKQFSQEHLKNLSESHKGYKPTEEQKRKISESQLGKPKPAVSKAQLGVSRGIGRKHTEEHRANISKGLTKYTDEERKEARKQTIKKSRAKSDKHKEYMKEYGKHRILTDEQKARKAELARLRRQKEKSLTISQEV